MTMTEEAVRAMTDTELAAFAALVQAERAVREKRRKEETIARIRALAATIDVPVSIGGARGRRMRAKHTAAPPPQGEKPESAA